MNEIPDPTAAEPPHPALRSMHGPAQRSVHRAFGELRRGAPVLLRGAVPLVLLAAETASANGIADAARVAATAGGEARRVRLLVSEARARALAELDHPDAGSDAGAGADAGAAGGIAALDAAASFEALVAMDPALLRGLADPTLEPPARTSAAALRRGTAPTLGAAALAALKLARLLPAALVSEASADAEMRARAADVLAVDADTVLAHAERGAVSLEIVASAPVPLLDAASSVLVAFRAPDAGIEHVAVVIGDPAAKRGPDGTPTAPLVRLHSECFTGDLLGSLRCDCGDQLRGAIRSMEAEGAGVLLYLAQEGRGIGLVNKLRAYTLQDRGFDTLDANRALGWEADERSFRVASTMLERLGIGRIRLLTNNPDKVASLSACGIEVVERVGIVVPPNGVDDLYLSTKRRRFGHLLG